MVVRNFSRALVTGASSGIGREFARELARRGTSVVLVARSGDALRTLADELRAAHDVEVEVLPADLTDPDALAGVEDRLRQEDGSVDLLINNAGSGGVGRFEELDIDQAQQQIALNVLAPVRLAHAALPRLHAVGGGLLNVSSIGGNQPVPYMAVYAGTKAFLTGWTEAIHEELRSSAVRVTVLAPGFTATDFAERADASGPASRVPWFVWADPASVARAGIEGVARGRLLVTPGPLYRLGVIAAAATPSAVTRRMLGAVIPRLRD